MRSYAIRSGRCCRNSSACKEHICGAWPTAIGRRAGSEGKLLDRILQRPTMRERRTRIEAVAPVTELGPPRRLRARSVWPRAARLRCPPRAGSQWRATMRMLEMTGEASLTKTSNVALNGGAVSAGEVVPAIANCWCARVRCVRYPGWRSTFCYCAEVECERRSPPDMGWP
jgi:hypothetical protein